MTIVYYLSITKLIIIRLIKNKFPMVRDRPSTGDYGGGDPRGRSREPRPTPSPRALAAAPGGDPRPPTLVGVHCFWF